MEKRPVSLTIIGWLLVVFALFGIYGLVTAGSNPIVVPMLAKMGISLALYEAWGALGIIIGLVCAYGILKGQPWSRVLYLVWGIIGLVVGLYISPIKSVLVISLIFLIVICVFLWTNAANDWFQARGLMLKREAAR